MWDYILYDLVNNSWEFIAYSLLFQIGPITLIYLWKGYSKYLYIPNFIFFLLTLHLIYWTAGEEGFEGLEAVASLLGIGIFLITQIVSLLYIFVFKKLEKKKM